MTATRLVVTFVATLVLGIGLAVGVAPAPAHASAASDYAQAAHSTTNKQRTTRDLRALSKDACLQRFAASHARRMAGQQRMFHQSLAPVLLECGLALTGENVAYGYSTGRAVVTDGWMRSPGHRANILKRGYRVMAVAARKGPDGRWYACQLFGRRLL